MLLVFSKADLLSEDARQELRIEYPDAVLLSGATGEGLEALGRRIEQLLRSRLRAVELLVPYSDGPSLAELHALAGELAERHTPEGVIGCGHSSGAPSPGASRASRSPRSPPEGAQRSSPEPWSTPRRWRESSFSRFSGRDRLELQVQLRGELCHVPEHVAQLLRHRLAALRGHLRTVVADHLLGVLRHLARLARQAQRRVDQPGLARVAGRAT